MRKCCAWACVMPMLSACLGGDIVTPSEARDLERRSGQYDVIRTATKDLPNSAWAAMPATGAITMTGVASLRVGEPGARTALVGDAVLTFDFDSGGVDGRLDRFFGVNANRDLAEYRGAVVLANGAIGVDRPNDWRAGYAGSLRGNSDDITLNGAVTGDFRATPVQAATGREQDGDLAVLNDRQLPVRLDIAITTDAD